MAVLLLRWHRETATEALHLHHQNVRLNRIDVAYFLGIDGGGTRTTAWIADAGGRILGRAASGASNPVKVGLAIAERRLLGAARGAMKRAGIRGRQLDACCAGVAGVDRPGTRARLLASLRNGIPARRVLVTTDGVIALEAALGGSTGVLVISGTGSIAYARDNQGPLRRCGGWGSLFDDAGSGYDIGRKALAAALRGADGRGPKVRFVSGLARALDVSEITEIAGRTPAPHQVAGLFPVIEQAARRGDPLARRLCNEAGRDLAELAWALLRQMSSVRCRVVITGGVFKASARVRRNFTRELHRVARHARVSLLRREPVEGALALARSLAEGGRG
jgi:N-acetylglucosamine kinase-like BadF-type ATPase